jgi:hypothetical protein
MNIIRILSSQLTDSIVITNWLNESVESVMSMHLQKKNKIKCHDQRECFLLRKVFFWFDEPICVTQLPHIEFLQDLKLKLLIYYSKASLN